MASFILTSYIHSREKDNEGVKHPVVIPNTNGVLDEITKRLKGLDRVVFVANDPEDIVTNDEKGGMFFTSLKMTWISFKENIILDCRNSKYARKILSGANLVILSGGKILKQNSFLKEINLKDILKEFDGLVVGISAGSMNLCKTVFNFPEEPIDVDCERIVEGLGICDRILIPHFDCEKNKYLIDCDEFDITGDYILPFSKKEKLLGLGNDSYIIIDDGKEVIVGDCVVISNGNILRL